MSFRWDLASTRMPNIELKEGIKSLMFDDNDGDDGDDDDDDDDDSNS